MSFKNLIEPVSTKPQNGLKGPGGPHGFLRDQLSITTWLALGAVTEGLLFLVLGRLALLPVVALLGYRIADTWLITMGWRSNPYMEGVISKKFTTQIPRADGTFSEKPADSQVVVFLIGTRNNHPLGLLAPGFKTVGNYFGSMTKTLEEKSEEYGFLGMTSWISSNQRETQNELMNVCYFRDYEGLHKFAHSEHHREGWRWFTRSIKDIPHISIFHETYVVPKGHWETVYANSHVGHMARTTYPITDNRGETKWLSPIVDASHGALRSAKGRMSKSDGSENDVYEKVASV